MTRRPAEPSLRVFGGIDEAGYGPMLGPLTFGFSAFELKDGQGTLDWQRLSGAVSEAPKDDGKKLIVADSKKVFTRNPRGSARLELTALTFLKARGVKIDRGADLLGTAPEELVPSQAELEAHPWYAHLPSSVPLHASQEKLNEHAGRLDETLRRSKTSVVASGAVVIPSGKLNASFAATQNKGATLWSFHSRVLLDLFERFGAQGLHMTVDRLGGRARYGAMLSQLIPFSTVRVMHESRIESRYLVSSEGRYMSIRFIQKGDTLSLPVALGSCLAKYAREMVMDAFNEHFCAACPDVKPTAGYVTDARRWLKDLEAKDPSLLRAAGILIRTR
jgi:ribonuclease HII